MGREVLTLDIIIKRTDMLKTPRGEVCMIHFDGYCHSELFDGKIIPDGIDTQVEMPGKTRTLSARYIMEGKDIEGYPCSIFVENNGTVTEQGILTKPRIITDSRALAFLEKADLYGTISETEEPGHIQIHISERK